ncbi:glycoside hydrolase [Microbacterium panaciterrae]|uniref:Family 43 glycosylhydrolase n=1 Tax=Microbacterium panaciterrae TaxID=985759 RepID=A0ABP8PRA9_9MICO
MTDGMSRAKSPLFRDPIHDGATDPVVVFNRAEKSWWMVYTARRADAPPLPGVEWVHGSGLGVASSDDGGSTWTYRGIIEGLDQEWGHHTYWAPEILDDGQSYHMYVSVIRGIPSIWPGFERRIRHYTSPDLVTWTYRSTLELSSPYVIDACVATLPDGGYRMWYKDEADDSSTWYADSPDLFSWKVGGPVLTHRPHEGPNVFPLGASWWMIVDEWHGQRVLRSQDLRSWEPQGLILNQPGSRTDDAAPGHHADVVPVSRDEAVIFYFTHPGRTSGSPAESYETRRSSIQAARLRVVDGTLICDRDEVLPEPLLTDPGTR